MTYYILKGRKVIPATLEHWGRFLQSRARIVAQEEHNGQRVSTVFIGIDYGSADGPPIVFETMIFDGPHDGWMERCATWKEAKAMHAKALAMVERGGE